MALQSVLYVQRENIAALQVAPIVCRALQARIIKILAPKLLRIALPVLLVRIVEQELLIVNYHLQELLVPVALHYTLHVQFKRIIQTSAAHQ